VKAYQPETLVRLFQAADKEDLVLFHFFLGSGCRDNEVVHAPWEDLDIQLRTYDVKEKPELLFEVKDHEERTVPLPKELIHLLTEHRKRHPTERFLFPGSDGQPDNHLIRRLKRLALKAGLNCGRCVSKKGLTCDEYPVCKEWTLHRFRKTFATMHAGCYIHGIGRLRD
jgi:integrase/recombinase XerD